jgi:DNA-directed RNA polymerase subunit RPC12/RpoP
MPRLAVVSHERRPAALAVIALDRRMNLAPVDVEHAHRGDAEWPVVIDYERDRASSVRRRLRCPACGSRRVVIEPPSNGSRVADSGELDINGGVSLISCHLGTNNFKCEII